MAKRVKKEFPINPNSMEYELAKQLGGKIKVDNLVTVNEVMLYELLRTKLGMYFYGRLNSLANKTSYSINIALEIIEEAPERSRRLSNTTKRLLETANEKDPQRKKSSPRRNLSKMPSERFVGWRDKQVDKWNPTDFLGYYLHKFLKMNDYEDDMFVGSIEFKRYIRQIRLCWELHFDGSHIELKDYIDKMFTWFATKDCWVTTPGFSILFKSSGNVLMKEYRKINKGGTKATDSKWSNNDTWSKKIGGK